MGLFGKLFSKETCAICGQEVGALKKRKLVDGMICKDCDDKLSPWFQTRSESTLAEIKSQLAMREQNRALLEQFVVTRQFGEYGGVFFDDDHGWFCVVEDRGGTLIGNKGAVDGVEGLRYRNVDIVQLSDVIAVDDFVNESRVEVKGHDKDGKQVSYHPEHWRYTESFGLRIRVSHPYLNEMRVILGTTVIEVEEERLRNRFLDGARFLGESATDGSRGFRISGTSYDSEDNSYNVTLTGPTYTHASSMSTKLDFRMNGGGSIGGTAAADVGGGTWSVTYCIGADAYDHIDWSKCYLTVDTVYCNNPNHKYLYGQVVNLTEAQVMTKAGFTADEKRIFQAYLEQIRAIGG